MSVGRPKACTSHCTAANAGAQDAAGEAARHCKRKGVERRTGQPWTSRRPRLDWTRRPWHQGEGHPDQAPAKAYSREEELDLFLRSSFPTHASLRR